MNVCEIQISVSINKVLDFPGGPVVKNLQGIWIRSLVREDSTCHESAERISCNYQVRVLQLMKSACLELVLHNKRSHHNEKPKHCNEG